ncbi:hypothetical protein [Prevotella denticola]|uniref:hypothetical protein n=1 Tax=Prevotella denticola TaxID=28129 RepID=UPI001C5DDC63|nr:hypothetical protein [Prevotella denticola]MBW4759649.1 hypothetical protein [Prevotella denticola]
MVIKTIKLTSLFVNTENYRFEPLTSQKEAIDKMVEDQGDKLYSLVDDIVINGLSPVDLIIVTPNEDNNKYTVLEGNRRITSLKLLNNPTLVDDKYVSLRKKFQKLQKENPNAISELKNITCAVFENPTEADVWIKRKHSGELNGIGTVTWNAQQKQRFEEKTEGKSSIPLQIITLLKSQENVSDTIKDSLSKLNITNLQRLMSDPYVREQLGLGINNGTLVSKVEVSEVVKGLVKVVTDILNPEFKVSEIYNREKRKQYIDNFNTSQKPDLSNEASEQWSVQDIVNNKGRVLINSEPREIKKTNKKKPGNRAGLVPKTLILHINNPKINKIFEELKQVQVKTCPNASSVLLRVFLELSVDVYLERYDLVKNNAITACSSNENLNAKVCKVLNHMSQLGTMSNDLSKGIRAEINEKNSVLSIESLNAYVHNEFFYPKADNLITGWDNIEIFFIQLWKSINKE